MATTPVTAWQGPLKDEVTLPSGNVALLRQSFPVYTLLRIGKFPQHLFEAFDAYTEGSLTDPDLAAELLDLIVSSMFIEPKVVTGNRRPKDGLLVSDLDDKDVDTVLARAMKGDAEASSFRADGSSDESGADGEGVGDDPEQPSRDGAGDAGVADAGHPAS